MDAPETDFGRFVTGLATNALLYMGAIPAPEGVAVSLPLAQQNIDFVAMLEEKTRGNLTPQEQKLVHELLYDLRLRFVEATSKQAG